MRAALLIAALALAACGASEGGAVEGREGRADASLECTDTQSDPMNCGFCDRTCVIPNATAGCELGECVIAACDSGRLDEDGDLANGCEHVEGQPAAPLECSPEKSEVCNAFDDNCDDECDEGREANCRQGVHRGYGAGHHIFSSELGDLAAPFEIEAQNFFFTYAAPGEGLLEAFLCLKSDNTHLLSQSADCEGLGTQVRSIGYWSEVPSCGGVPLFGLHHPGSNNHFYTRSAGERDNAMNNLGYTYEGIAAYVWTEQ